VFIDISFLFPRRIDSAMAGLEEAKNLAGKCPPHDSDPRSDAEFWKISPTCQAQSAASAACRFKLQKSRQLFMRTHNVTLPVVAVCVNNPNGSPFTINR
jgi:hypothetical protein